MWPLSARPYGIALGARFVSALPVLVVLLTPKRSNWMNNFIVGQVTPDMITGMRYGRCLADLGAIPANIVKALSSFLASSSSWAQASSGSLSQRR